MNRFEGGLQTLTPLKNWNNYSLITTCVFCCGRISVFRVDARFVRWSCGSSWGCTVCMEFNASCGRLLLLQQVPIYAVRCSNVVEIWSEVKMDFDLSSAVICVAPAPFKRWSRFNSERRLITDQILFSVQPNDVTASTRLRVERNYPIGILANMKNLYIDL